ncbi:hypothetical protein AAG906_020771 [Vitis piasezkii]
MSCSLVRSLGVGRFLEWAALDSRGMVEGRGRLELETIGDCGGSVVHRGDFNVIRFLGERNSISRLSSAMRRFSEIIEDLELRDLPLQGGSFTWRGGLNNQFKVFYLDLFLTTAQFCWTVEEFGTEKCLVMSPLKDLTLKEMMFWDSIEGIGCSERAKSHKACFEGV